MTPPILPSEGTTPQQVEQDSGTGGGSGSLPALNFGAGDWQGAFAGDQSWYGGNWVALYAAGGSYPRASLRFNLDAQPTGEVIWTVTGLSDEHGTNFPIAVEVNGQIKPVGDAPFSHWNTAEHGQHGEGAPWTTVQFKFGADALREGTNEIAIVSYLPGSASGPPAPYVLLRNSTITFE